MTNRYLEKIAELVTAYDKDPVTGKKVALNADLNAKEHEDLENEYLRKHDAQKNKYRLRGAAIGGLGGLGVAELIHRSAGGIMPRMNSHPLLGLGYGAAGAIMGNNISRISAAQQAVLEAVKKHKEKQNS